MAKKSLINDVSLGDEEGKGDPILFPNPLIRRMLGLADAGDNDIFYDLGSGWGQNLIVALTEFNVKKCIGIEEDKCRSDLANKRLERLKLSERGFSINAKYEDLFKNKIKGASLKEATIVFYGLSTDAQLLNDIKKNMQRGARLVYYYNGLFPEIKANKSDYPFFVSIYPFKKPTSELDWLRSVVKKENSIINPKQEPSAKELWDELKHDYDVNILSDTDVKSYQRRLRKLLKRKR